ncbi:putative hydrolase [Actinacidiphila reveromycinica]|uniref:Putative hydrolase n=1 Tax=Actinacidiphila reveromycinica TaxID=659352 RepID=A0A7U3VR83_9ACTN|nr:GH25 family lysozyme [Streptomyces sp. SN-593]BBB00566.1 putative hydrolase [Streptomyces sp. SN-593]BBB00619.1 putative hydrolase [Streptomyces sp. SN-593]
MTVNGIDVASYQTSTFSTSGLGFVMVKATEGTSYINPKHTAQVAHARAAGVTVGHYHFARPGSMSAQVAYFLQHAAAAPGDVLALDWEDTGVSGADKDAFIKALQKESPAHRVLLYCNVDFWLHRDTTSFCGDGLWIADPESDAGHPRVEHAWTLHQYSVSGGVDRNVANFASSDALTAWAAKGSSGAVPKYEPFPGASWFTVGRKSPVVAAMHARLVAVSCNHYQTSSNKDVIGSGDIASYQAWQRKCGYSGAAATWPPGKTTWDKLHVPTS